MDQSAEERQPTQTKHDDKRPGLQYGAMVGVEQIDEDKRLASLV